MSRLPVFIEMIDQHGGRAKFFASNLAQTNVQVVLQVCRNSVSIVTDGQYELVLQTLLFGVQGQVAELGGAAARPKLAPDPEAIAAFATARADRSEAAGCQNWELKQA